MSSTNRVGAPKGNLNALKHGFYTRRIKKTHLTGVETTDISSLIEEIALIRIFMRRLIEDRAIDDGHADLADTLRILCLASATITRIIKTQFLLSTSGMGVNDEIAEAIRQVNAELCHKFPFTASGDSPPSASGPPSYTSHRSPSPSEVN